MTKGEELISRYGSGKQSQQITIREKSLKKRGIQQKINLRKPKDEFDFSIISKVENKQVYIEICKIKFLFFTKKN